MDDRTTTAYSSSTHHFVPGQPRPHAAAGRQQTLLRMAPQPPESSRSDEAGLIWLDDDDLLSAADSFTAAKSGKANVLAKCIMPSMGLFAAVLFGHVILAASGQAAQAAPKHVAVAPPAAAASTNTPAAAPSSAALQQPDGVEEKSALPNTDATPQPANHAPASKSARSHRQHYADGAHGSGAGEPSTQDGVPSQPGLLRINSRPWAQVTLDGHPLGNTPLFDVRVAPGAHTLVLSNPDFQVSKTIHLDVAAGETVRRVVSLQE